MIASIKTPDGLEAVLGEDRRWTSEDSEFEDMLNTHFFPDKLPRALMIPERPAVFGAAIAASDHFGATLTWGEQGFDEVDPQSVD
jgi:hypothetical protein